MESSAMGARWQGIRVFFMTLARASRSCPTLDSHSCPLQVKVISYLNDNIKKKFERTQASPHRAIWIAHLKEQEFVWTVGGLFIGFLASSLFQ